MVEKKEWIDKNEHAWSGESGPSVLLTTLRSTRVSNASREAAYDDVQNFGLLRQPALNAGCYSRLQLRQDFLPSIHGLLEKEITALKKKSCREYAFEGLSYS